MLSEIITEALHCDSVKDAADKVESRKIYFQILVNFFVKTASPFETRTI